MNAEALQWLDYAGENLEMARVGLERELLNASMQNAQQAVEKALKALLINSGNEIPRTHSIRELVRQTVASGISVDLSIEECDLLDAIYIPSKYPVYGILPGDVASRGTCESCLLIAERLVGNVRG
jgi:HEPN domain-containing protein